jgi:hypothetical protein
MVHSPQSRRSLQAASSKCPEYVCPISSSRPSARVCPQVSAWPQPANWFREDEDQEVTLSPASKVTQYDTCPLPPGHCLWHSQVQQRLCLWHAGVLANSSRQSPAARLWGRSGRLMEQCPRGCTTIETTEQADAGPVNHMWQPNSTELNPRSP